MSGPTARLPAPPPTSLPAYEEKGSLTVHIELSASFDDAYEGDDDGYAWLERWRREVQPQLVRAVFSALRSDPAFDAIPVSRGRSPEEHIDVEVRFRPERNPRKTLRTTGG